MVDRYAIDLEPEALYQADTFPSSKIRATRDFKISESVLQRPTVTLPTYSPCAALTGLAFRYSNRFKPFM